MQSAKLLFVFILAVASGLSARPARADTITDLITFNATFSSGPLPNVAGSFTVTFDPTREYSTDTRDGVPRDIVVNRITPAFAGLPITFSFFPEPNIPSAEGFMSIGGAPFPQGVACGTTGFFVPFTGILSQQPKSPGVVYSLDQFPPDVCFFSRSVEMMVQSASPPTVIPEPASLPILITGLGGLAGVLRRRWCSRSFIGQVRDRGRHHADT